MFKKPLQYLGVLAVSAQLLLLQVYTEESIKQEWLTSIPASCFSLLSNLSPQSIEGYQEKLAPYLRARGVSDDGAIEDFVHQDLLHMAHALSILFEQDPINVLSHFLGEQYYLIEGYHTHIDHVGRELFGPLSFYLPLLARVADQLGLIHLRHIVFPSTQVVKELQRYDPDLRGVTIARIYFQNICDGKIRCLELFQAAPLDEEYPQNIEATKARLLSLTESCSSSLQSPIDHLALELSKVEDVEKMHQHIHGQASENLKLCQERVSYNPGDGSTQTKMLLKDGNAAVFNKIIEFVHYERK